jgi:hypothetical protein
MGEITSLVHALSGETGAGSMSGAARLKGRTFAKGSVRTSMPIAAIAH